MEQYEEDIQQEFGGEQYEESEVSGDVENLEQESSVDAYMEPDEEERSAAAEAEKKEQRISEKKEEKDQLRRQLQNIQREKYKALEEARLWKEEAERLSSVSGKSSKLAIAYYEDSAQKSHEAAKAKKLRGHEIGDIELQMEADIEIAKTVNELSHVQRLKSEQEAYEQQQAQYQAQRQQHQAQEPIHYNQDNGNYWVQENSWFGNPHSEEYDPDLTSQVQEFCTAFDRNLYQAGRGRDIMSPEYFEILNQHVNTLRSGNHKGDLRMRPTRSPVSAVRSGQAQRSAQSVPQQDRLSDEERDMARRLGLDEKVYLQHQLHDRKENAYRRVRR